MGLRTNVGAVEFSGVLEEDVESALKDAAQVSMGTEISDEDLNSIKDLADQVGPQHHPNALHTSSLPR